MPLAPPPAAPVCAGVSLPAIVDRYAALTRAQDVAALARFYGHDGVLVGAGGAPITGAGEVARFLGGFSGYRVSEDAMTVGHIESDGAGWRVAGAFRQRGTTPAGAAFATGGGYRTTWLCRPGGWRVQRMATFPGEETAR